MKPLIILYVLFSFVDCRHATPPPPPAHISTVKLTLQDALCTEVWLKLAFTDTARARDFALVRKDASGASQTIFAGQLLGNDTTLVDTSAQPSKNYTYTAYRMNGSTMVDWSSDIVVTTMPTTSHNFTWEIDTLGSGNSSYFKDVAIINDNDVWAVGAIYVDTSFYNAAHWDGAKWNLQHASWSPFNAVFGFSINDVWAATSAPYHWNGTAWKGYNVTGIFGGYVNKIWGTSSTNVFIVGGNGSIAHFDGQSWLKMESGTTVDLRDVWGTSDGSIVWACGYSNDYSQSVLLRFDSIGWHTLWTAQQYIPYGGLVTSLYAAKPLYIASTKAIWCQYVTSATSPTKMLALTDFVHRIRGSADNNIAMVADGLIWHYNGADWSLVVDNTSVGQPLYSVAVSQNLVVAVGAHFSSLLPKAVVYFGKRTN